MISYPKLLAVAGASLSPCPPNAWLVSAGPRHAELHALLALRNGFMSFENSLHVFSSTNEVGSLEEWNKGDRWRNAYGKLADGYLFFAQDLFGNQFGISNDKIFLFEAETGSVDEVSTTIDGWVEAVMSECELLTGFPLAHSWQCRNGQLALGDRLVAKTPFVLGGAYDAENLYSLHAEKAMRFYGDLATQLQSVPDGEKINLKVVR